MLTGASYVAGDVHLPYSDGGGDEDGGPLCDYLVCGCVTELVAKLPPFELPAFTSCGEVPEVGAGRGLSPFRVVRHANMMPHSWHGMVDTLAKLAYAEGMTESTTTAIPRYLINDALVYVNGADIIDGYSGRGMYGGTCFAVNLPNAADVGAFMFWLGVAYAELDDSLLEERVGEMIGNTRTDSMGCGIVMYFPGFTLEG